MQSRNLGAHQDYAEYEVIACRRIRTCSSFTILFGIVDVGKGRAVDRSHGFIR